jgi:hypothetical protein
MPRLRPLHFPLCNFTHFLCLGCSLPRPRTCPAGVFEIMSRCWKISPLERPLFALLEDALVNETGSLMQSESSGRLGGTMKSLINSSNDARTESVSSNFKAKTMTLQGLPASAGESSDDHDYEYQEEVNMAFKPLAKPVATDDSDADAHDHEYQQEVAARFDQPQDYLSKAVLKFNRDHDDEDENDMIQPSAGLAKKDKFVFGSSKYICSQRSQRYVLHLETGGFFSDLHCLLCLCLLQPTCSGKAALTVCSRTRSVYQHRTLRLASLLSSPPSRVRT